MRSTRRPTTYESADSDNVIMSGAIARFHDEDASPTGALDTNADGDVLMYTAANLEGRIQITATWFDELDRVIIRRYLRILAPQDPSDTT